MKKLLRCSWFVRAVVRFVFCELVVAEDRVSLGRRDSVYIVYIYGGIAFLVRR